MVEAGLEGAVSLTGGSDGRKGEPPVSRQRMIPGRFPAVTARYAAGCEIVARSAGKRQGGGAAQRAASPATASRSWRSMSDGKVMEIFSAFWPDSRCVASQRPGNHVGLPGDHAQIGQSRRIGLLSVLLPVPQRADRHVVSRGEFGLRDA